MNWRPIREIFLCQSDPLAEALETYLVVVDPDLVRVVEGDGITAPDILGVEILLDQLRS
jgi:hypothetical protein